MLLRSLARVNTKNKSSPKTKSNGHIIQDEKHLSSHKGNFSKAQLANRQMRTLAKALDAAGKFVDALQRKCHNVPPSLLDFSQHLSLPRASRLVTDLSSLLKMFPRHCPDAITSEFDLHRSGVWVGEWVNLVNEYLDVLQLMDSIILSHQPFAESLFLRVAKGFLKPGPSAKNGIAHIVSTAMIVAASRTRLASLPEDLLGQINSSVCGLFLGPSTPHACTPSGASQHIHFIALTATVPKDIEPFWPGGT
ncbi:hypothetical protein VP01_1364g1 [Puccinia sorghi]|uniref:Uncharacterized protein n=1 Tax=Puccinia sorghi TaxID=27349 RepID=A0A0L6VMC0_9BASI|nr:hypothetical protein VP01_1364g1 [Puccinia sorghi]